MESHSISLLFSCLNNFYKNMNYIKNDYGGNKLLSLIKNFIHYT